MPVRRSRKVGGARRRSGSARRRSGSARRVMKASKTKSNVDMANLMGRCMKCKKQQKMAGASPVVMKNGRNAAKGNCPVCGTKMYRIV